MRALSTALDTTVFLLLVGGAVATLVVGTAGIGSPPAPADHADERLELLATTTATVEYELTPARSGVDGIDYEGVSGSFDRTAHGTAAGLLRAATRSSVSIAGERLAPASGGFERAVANETRTTVRHPEVAVGVTARWAPYDGAPIDSTIHVGPRPPARADVRVARLQIDSGFDPTRRSAFAAAREDGFGGVAEVLACSLVTGLFPTNETRYALRGDAPADTLTAHRYRRVARLTDAPLLHVQNASTAELNRDLEAALTDQLATDMRSRFASPAAAAEAVSTEHVTIVVRTWSP